MTTTVPQLDRHDHQQPIPTPDLAAPAAADVRLPTSPAGFVPHQTWGRRFEPLREISESECLRLLGSVPMGRVAYDNRTRPVITVVHHVLHGRDIAFALMPADPAIRWRTVAFQADSIDYTTGSGWSIVAVGEARPVPPGPETRRIRGSLMADLPETAQLVRVKIESIAGWRIEPTWNWPPPRTDLLPPARLGPDRGRRS